MMNLIRTRRQRSESMGLLDSNILFLKSSKPASWSMQLAKSVNFLMELTKEL